MLKKHFIVFHFNDYDIEDDPKSWGGSDPMKVFKQIGNTPKPGGPVTIMTKPGTSVIRIPSEPKDQSFYLYIYSCNVGLIERKTTTVVKKVKKRKMRT